MKHLNTIFLFGVLLSLTSCGSMKINRLMKTHHNVLSEAAYSKTMSPAEKLDVLGGTFVSVINESLTFVNILTPKF